MGRNPMLVVSFLFFAATAAAGEPLTLEMADNRLAIAERMLEGGIYERAGELANEILSDPAARGQTGSPDEIAAWLRRREAARFIMDRSRFGMAVTREQFLDAAGSLVQLANNRYRLGEPAYNVQAAYWAGRAYEAAENWSEAVGLFSRVGGVSLPAGMEGDAAQRTSRCLRRLAEEIPYPGTARDRQYRSDLLNRAVTELDRSRLAFPVGNRRKEIELDRIALRMARREGQFIREAMTEAEIFIAGEPSKDELRARAALFRGQAAAMLGNPADAVIWFRKVATEENPSDEDRRWADIGLGLALAEMSGLTESEEKNRLLGQAAVALEKALDGVVAGGSWDNVRVVLARILITLERYEAALETLAPVVAEAKINHAAWREAGMAELRRGRLNEAIACLYPPTRPSNPNSVLRREACQEAARIAEARRDFGLAMALNHQASRLLRGERLFSTLLMVEFQAMEILLKLGRMDNFVSFSSDTDILMQDSDALAASIQDKRRQAVAGVAEALGHLLAGGGDPDTAYDLAMQTEAAYVWSGDSRSKLELSIGMISHLRQRRPAGVSDRVLSSRLGDARYTLALARADAILSGLVEPTLEEIELALGDFTSAADIFQDASAGGFSVQDSLNQGMVSLESGGVLMRLAERWNRGKWSALAISWSEDARQRIESSLTPFNHAIATSAPSSPSARLARWLRGRALEFLGEWRTAAADYLSLMNNSELPRVFRANSARRWAICMGELGESRQALARLAVFADIDAEASLLAGRLADASDNPREAYQRYLFAANPSSPALPPATPGRFQEASYRAARLALEDPNEADPLQPAAAVVSQARTLLERAALADISSPWTVTILNLLGESWIQEEPEGWRTAHRIAMNIIENPVSGVGAERAMHILAAKALTKAGRHSQALDELDSARELLDETASGRYDAAIIILETARIYRNQGRNEDAIRAYADVFAVHPEEAPSADAARQEAALLLLAMPGAGDREREQARNILNGVRDQRLAERIMREYGMR
ncbi:MAG: hypothetical protein FWG74_00805 [Planctomycetes bacterium]|nr:hypothetical protein [Planctomycetota bacterium]